MRIFYLSTAMPDGTYEDIVRGCRVFKPTYSGVGFDRNVAEGMADFAEITTVSLAPIPSFPKYEKLVWRRRIATQDALSYLMPAMLNLPVLKELWFMVSAARHLLRWCKQDQNNRTILISGLFRCYILPAAIARVRYGAKLYAIVPDLPEVMSTYRKDYSAVRKLLNKLDIRLSKRFRGCIDGFILLTEPMNPVVNHRGVPHIVVDGMVKIPDCFTSETEEKDTSAQRVILYAGKLSRRFGVDKLIEAFLLAELDHCQLLLYGDGDYADEIQKIAASHEPIVYGGVVPHQVILREERQADLLVDPRPSDLTVSRMAFPSKIIEYMASGTPVLTTNLPCFDKAYADYQYRFSSESVPGMADTLKRVMSLEKTERERFGLRARAFVLNEKTVEKQCGKIYRFIKDPP